MLENKFQANLIKELKERFALTTFDNPYDPFEQFTQWFMFDEEPLTIYAV